MIGTTHAADVETLVNRVVEQDLPTHLLDEIDLLVFPRHTDGDRYVSDVVEFVSESQFREYEREREDGRCGVIRKGEATVYWNAVARRTAPGEYEFAYEHPDLGDDDRRLATAVFDRIATLTDRPVEAVEAEFHRKHGYVQYLDREGITSGNELFAFLADLQSDEAATVERIRGHDGLADSGGPATAGRSHSTPEIGLPDGASEHHADATDGQRGRASGDGDRDGTRDTVGDGGRTAGDRDERNPRRGDRGERDRQDGDREEGRRDGG